MAICAAFALEYFTAGFSASIEALSIMVQEHIRHLPVVDEQGRPQAVVYMRSLLEEKVKELHQQLDSLESYFTADGIGG